MPSVRWLSVNRIEKLNNFLISFAKIFQNYLDLVTFDLIDLLQY